MDSIRGRDQLSHTPVIPEPEYIDGFILSREWRDQNNSANLVIWATTDKGPMEILIQKIDAIMFIKSKDVDRIPQQIRQKCSAKPLDLKSLDDDRVHALYFPTRADLDQAHQQLIDIGVDCFEADVQPAERFLQERFIRGGFNAYGSIENKNGSQRLINPTLKSSAYIPRLSVLSLDIETSGNGNQIYSIAYVSGQVHCVLVSGDPCETASVDFDIQFFPTERDLLLNFLKQIQKLDPDVVIGWNIINFDLTILEKKYKEHGIKYALGRDRSLARIIPARKGGLNAIARIPGRVVLDGIECLKTAFWLFDSYSLEHVSQHLLGKGKEITNQEDKIQEITRRFYEDKLELARYNIQDCRLVIEIFHHTKLLEFSIERSRITGLHMGRQGGSVAAFDYLYLPQLHRKGWIAPTYSKKSYTDSSPGGYVLDSVPGIFDNVMVMDFKSLYPSIIRTFKIDPLGLAQPGENAVPGFLDASFSRDENILPKVLEELWERRDKAKQENNQPLSQAIKILMNSFYGVLGAEGCRFYHPKLASSITRRGHEIIRKSKTWIEAAGYQVIYGDTDSLFVLLNRNQQDLLELGKELVDGLNSYWKKHIEENFKLPSYLEVEFEVLFKKFFMPSVRGSEAGSKKRYAGITGDDIDSLIIKGLEAVRSDWTDFAREFQKQLLYAVFMESGVDELIKNMVEKLRSGIVDDQLIYRKKLRQPIAAYKKNIPPHVRAAMQLDRPSSEIRYYITINGPQPLEKLESPLDYDHYIQRQVKPIADSIIQFKGMSFDDIAGLQRDLFSTVN